jgi:hypothetical protein
MESSAADFVFLPLCPCFLPLMVFLENIPVCMVLFKPAKILRKIEFEGLTRIILTTALAANKISLNEKSRI